MRCIWWLLFCLVFTACSLKRDYNISQESSEDLPQISKRKRLVAIIDQNSTDYFVFKGEPMGFQFEMLKQLGQFLNLEVEIIVSNNMDDDFLALFEGKADIIAKSQAPSNFESEIVTYGLPLYTTKHVLVQRKQISGSKLFIKKPSELAGQNVYIPIRSAYLQTLNIIVNQVDGDLNVFEMPGYNAEHLVELVASKKLDYTVCDYEQAKIMKRQFPELDYSTVLSEENSVSWVFRKKSPELLKKVNDWLSYYRTSSQFAIKYRKYFEDRNNYANISHNYISIRTGRISRYDDLIKKYSDVIGWDWRLLASLIYQESRFKPNVKSHAGAFGLMQLMPSTRKYFGVDTTSTVEDQIRAGVMLIKLLDKQIAPRIPDKEERIKFILASYNIGWGHILDAVKIAEKVGKDSQKWDNNVDSCLLSKSDPKILSLQEVKFGYARGHETYLFVKQVLNRFEHYKNLVSDK